MHEEKEVRMVTAEDPLLVVVVTLGEDGPDVFLDGKLPPHLRAGCLRAIAKDVETQQVLKTFANPN